MTIFRIPNITAFVAFVMTCGGGPAASQNIREPDPAASQSFFLAVAKWSRMAPESRAGYSSPPTIQQKLNLTDSEMSRLNDIALDCEAKVHVLEQAKSRNILEARVRLAESGEKVGSLVQQRKSLDEQIIRVVRDHISQVRRFLSVSGFRIMNEYVGLTFTR
jgi:hypothetical protein